MNEFFRDIFFMRWLWSIFAGALDMVITLVAGVVMLPYSAGF